MNTVSFVLTVLCGFTAVAIAASNSEKIFLRLFLSESEGSYKDAYVFNISEFVPYMDIKKNTVIYIHGFTEHINSSSVATIVNAYLQRDDHNIIAVDWSKLAGGNYMQVISHVEEVGTSIAQAINGIIKNGVSSSRIHLIGHSMGAHVAGTVGRKIGFSLSRITGLDPAGPFFNFFIERIKHTDAKFVDIVHTDAGFYGLVRPSGSVEFWPNGGIRVQPGCPSHSRVFSEEDFCSHHRSYEYYAESLINENAFLSIECSLKPASIMKNASLIPMGYATPVNATGHYCLITAANEPFGLAMDGVVPVPDPIIQVLSIAS